MKKFQYAHPNQVMVALSLAILFVTILFFVMSFFHIPAIVMSAIFLLTYLVNVRLLANSFLHHLDQENPLQVKVQDKTNYGKRYHRNLEVLRNLKVKRFYEIILASSFLLVSFQLDILALSPLQKIALLLFFLFCIHADLRLRKILRSELVEWSLDNYRVIHSDHLFYVWLVILSLVTMFLPVAISLWNAIGSDATTISFFIILIYVASCIFASKKK